MKEVIRWFHLVILLAALDAACAPPAIDVQPDDQTALAGGLAVFTAQASGTAPLYLQWRATLGNTFTNIPGATSTILTLTNVQTTTRRFALVATNSEGAVTSRLAALTVLHPPQFSTHPASVVAIDGSAVSLSASLTGNTPMKYQWFFNGSPLPGRTGTTLPLPAVTSADEGDYRLVATNSYGQATSRLARVAVIPNPVSLEPRVFTEVPALPLPYRLFVPPTGNGPAPAGPYPLLLFLHGAGERGSDNHAQVTDWPQPMVFISHANQTRSPMVFVAPQCPASKTWSDPDMVQLLPRFLASLANEFPIDTNRFYVTGLSMGGIGIWELLRVRPTLFAAAIPQSGCGDPSQVAVFRDVPIWNFHSASDSTVPVSWSQDVIQALRLAGGHPIYTEYADGGHAIWAEAYATPGLVEWTLAQHRGAPSTVPPDLSIETPPNDGVRTPLQVATNRVSLAGRVRTLWDTPTSLRWYKYTGSGSGALTPGGPPDWHLDGVGPLVEGVTRIGVVASTSSLAPALGGATTLSDTLDLEYHIPISLTATRDGETLRIDWAAGKGTFYLETSAEISPPVWGPRVPLLGPSINLPITDGNAYFRVVRE